MTDTDIPAEILARIDALAAKMGVAAEQLWPAIVGAARVSAITNVVIWFGAVALLAFAGYILHRMAEDDESAGMMACIVVMATIATASICLACAGTTISTIAYPEAAALRSLLP